MTQVYLRSDVYFEPLFNKWFMWPYLMSPATAAMNMTNQHLRLLRSYVANAKIHAKSANAKAMAGSALVNIPPERVDEVRQLLQNTEEDHQDLITLAAAIVELDQLLQQEATGLSLEPFYARVPLPLQGLVELHYDLNNQPSFRLIEALLYHSTYYKKSAQSVCLGNLPSNERPFVLSTPRLPDANHLHIDVPFDHPFVSRLFRMRDQSVDLAEILAEFAQLPSSGGVEFLSLLTTEPPTRALPAVTSGAEVRYLGHAGVMVRTTATTVMVDPVIAYKNDAETGKVTFDDLPPFIDQVMITHTHMDHLCLETLIQLRHKIGQVLVPKSNSGQLADPSMKLMLKALGFQNVLELEDMESMFCADIKVTALPFLGEHADVSIRSKAAWLIEAVGRKVLVAADSSNLDRQLYQRIHQIIGDVDMLFIGMECTGGPLRWLYGALLTQPISREANESRRFNGSDYAAASYMAHTFGAGQVYVYALGIEPWYGYFMGISYNENDIQLLESEKLVNECLARNIPSKRLQGTDVWFLPHKSTTPGSAQFKD